MMEKHRIRKYAPEMLFLFSIAFILISGISFFPVKDSTAAEADSMHHHTGHGNRSEGSKTPEIVVGLETIPKKVLAQVPAELQISLKDLNGKPLHGIRVTHERILHIVIVSEDLSVFAHLHPEDFGPVTPEMIQKARFTVHYTFPKAGRYLVALDSGVKDSHFSKQLFLDVSGNPKTGTIKTDFSSEKNYGDYRVKMTYTPGRIKAGKRTTLKYFIYKNNQPVTDLEPYLAAPMHIAIIKADLKNFIHAHGEVPGFSSPHHFVGHIHGTPQDNFGPEIKADVVFPVKGIYQIFSEIKHRGKITVLSFMVDVE